MKNDSIATLKEQILQGFISNKQPIVHPKKKKKVQFCTTLQTSAGSYMRVVIADKSFEFRFVLTVNRNISTERRFSFQFTQLLTFCTRKPEKKPVIRLTGWKSGLLKMFFPPKSERTQKLHKKERCRGLDTDKQKEI